MTISTTNYQTARFLLAQAQEYGNAIASESSVPLRVECDMQRDEEAGEYVVSVRFRIKAGKAE